jgi:hypothetical protein
MEDFTTRKIYIDSRFKTNTSVSDSNFSVMLPEVVSLPEKCVGIIDEIILPVMFYNVQEGVNDKLYIGVFHSGTTNYYTITLAEQNYDILDLGSTILTALNLLDPTNILFAGGGSTEDLKLTFQILDQRVSPPDEATFIFYDNNELESGAYNGSPIIEHQSINDVIQNYKKVPDQWSSLTINFVPDLHPIRNLYLCCSELSGYSSLTNFDWFGSGIVKKIPINVPFGSMAYIFQTITFDHFRCGNRSLSKLSFTLRNSHGKIVNLNNHWSFSILLSLENI